MGNNKSFLKVTTLSVLLASSGAGFQVMAADSPFAIAIHGGAGTIDKNKLKGKERQKYEQTLQQAVNTGYQLLAQGQSSQQAVIAAIKILEDSPLFNAGHGAVYTYDGNHDLDASIMDGQTLQAGAVAGVKTIKNPIYAS